MDDTDIDLELDLDLDLVSSLSEFYTEAWKREVEFQVLSSLHNEFLHSRWIAGDSANNQRVLEDVRRQLMEKKGADFDIPISSYARKLEEWKTRFAVFRFLTTCPLVWFNEESNRVYANAKTWDHLCLICQRVLWYKDEGESNLGFFKDLFRGPTINFW